MVKTKKKSEIKTVRHSITMAQLIEDYIKEKKCFRTGKT